MTTQSPHTRAARTLSALTILAVLTTACGNTEPTPRIDPTEFTLATAPDCETIHERIIDAYTERVLRQLFKPVFTGGWGPYNEDPNDPSNHYPFDYTESNTRGITDEGEPDLIKTDGQYIFTVSEDQLQIIQNSPHGQATIVGRYVTGSYNPNRSLLVKDHRVILFSVIPGNHVFGEAYGEERDYHGTRITIFDVSDPTAPRVERQFDIEGRLKTARLLDNKLFLTTQSTVSIPFHVGSWLSENISSLPATERTSDARLLKQRKNQVRAIVRERIAQDLADLDIQSILPRIRTPNTDGTRSLDIAPLYDTCTDFYLPHQITNSGLRNISSIDLEHPTHIQSTGLFADGWTIYATHQNLYVGMSNRSWLWGELNTPYETHIHKFELQPGKSKPVYTASGRVDGWLLNDRAMSEHDGHLRVVTADNHLGWGTSNGGSHSVTILQQQDNLLTKTGVLHNIAAGNPIHAARLSGNHGYLISSNPDDPIYTLDLSNPATPETLGHLPMDNKLQAIAPIDDHHLLAIYRSPNANHLNLQVFDVSNPQNPIPTHQHTTPITGSLGNLTLPTSFTYDAERQLLAVPLDINDEHNQDPFTGLVLIQITPHNGIYEVGRINHADLILHAHCNESPELPCDPGQNKKWRAYMRRSVFTTIDNKHYIYSLSLFGLKINDLHTPQTEYASVFLLY